MIANNVKLAEVQGHYVLKLITGNVPYNEYQMTVCHGNHVYRSFVKWKTIVFVLSNEQLCDAMPRDEAVNEYLRYN